MDIEILLWLQALRQSLGSIPEWFFLIVSEIAAGAVTLLLPCAIYWLFDKRAGLLTMLNFVIGNMANVLVKNTACIYRPWIRDSRITPSVNAIAGAGGYSFPSGHTQSAASEYLTLGWYWRKTSKWVLPTAVLATLLVMFSRMYLGCHTPQDVLFGFAISFPLIWLGYKLYDRFENGNDKKILIGSLILAVVSLAYFILKPYPLDYVGEELLVDPISMQKGAFEACGYFSGMVLGWYLERRYVCFDTNVGCKQKWIRLLVGVVLCLLAYLVVPMAVKLFIPYNWYGLLKGFLVFFTAVFVAPYVFVRLENRKDGKSDR